MLGLHFCARAFSSCGERGPLFIVVRGPLTVANSRCGARLVLHFLNYQIISLCMEIPYSFIHSSVNTHLGCFHHSLLWIMLLWIFVYKFWCGDMFSFLLGVYIYLEVKLMGYMLSIYLTFRGIARLFSKGVIPLSIPISSIQGFQFLHFLTNICYPSDYSHPSGCEIVSHCGFDLHFPDD